MAVGKSVTLRAIGAGVCAVLAMGSTHAPWLVAVWLAVAVLLARDALRIRWQRARPLLRDGQRALPDE